MKKVKNGGLTSKEERELLMEFDRMSSAGNPAVPLAPAGEFERIIAEMKKRNIIPQIRKELRNNYKK